jgi:FkbM family methyltransferase
VPHPSAESYRPRTIAERIARAIPTGGALAPIRRRLKPLFERWLASTVGSFRSVLPGGEVVLAVPEFRHMSWNVAEYAAFCAAVRPGAVILEAGANVGAYTILFAQWTGSAGRVFAFEPDPTAYGGLQRHLTLNAVADRVTPIQAAVSARDGELRFASFESSGISRMALPSEEAATTIRTVRARSIDSFCAEAGVTPAVLKIDVEGAELDALRGARETIARAGSGLLLFVEMHPQLWPAFGITADDLRAECDAQGLAAEHLDGSREELWRTEGVCLRLRPARA